MARDRIPLYSTCYLSSLDSIILHFFRCIPPGILDEHLQSTMFQAKSWLETLPIFIPRVHHVV